MSAKLVKKKSSENYVAIALALLLLLGGGCRQAPESNPQYYERELEQMNREAMQAKNVQKPLKDGYPWRGIEKKKDPCLPCRIKTMEKEIKVEIDYLHETVRGKKKTRLRLRD